MKLSSAQKAILALIIANIIWGAASPIFKWSLQNITPFLLAFLRFFIAATIMFLLLGKRAQLSFHTRKDHLLLYANALSGITFNIIFFFFGLRLTKSINAPVIASTAPIITMLFAYIFLREKFSGKKIVGVIFGIMGILVIVLEPLLHQGLDNAILGNLFLILAMLGAVGGTITGRSILTKYDPLAISFHGFLIGAWTFFPFAVWEFSKNPQIFSILDIRGWTGIVFGAIFSSAAAYTLFNWGLSKISATDTSMFNYIDPVVAVIIGYFLLAEPITLPFLLGSLLIFGGIFLAEGRLHYHPFHKLKK